MNLGNIGTSVWNSVRGSFGDSVWDSGWNSIRSRYESR